MGERILLGQLGHNGDCLYATILARQIRADHPDAHLTWAISARCAGVVANNPDIDVIWTIPHPPAGEHATLWRVFEREAHRRHLRGEFDRLVLSQIYPSHFENYDGTIRPSILRAYGRPITVPIENVIHLTPEEAGAVDDFARASRLSESGFPILVECTATSGQSFVTPDLIQEMASHLYQRLPEARVICSTHEPMDLKDRRSLHVGHLSLRQIARLTHHCVLFVGAGSGNSVAASSTASKPLPWIQLLRRETSMYASFAHDFAHFGLTSRPVIEMTVADPARIAAAIAMLCTEGVEAASARYLDPIPLTFDHYFGLIESHLLSEERYLDAARSLSLTLDRYGWREDLAAFAARRVLPYLDFDPSAYFSDNRKAGEVLRARLAARHDRG